MTSQSHTGRRETARRALSALAVVLVVVLVAPFAVYAVPQTVGADYGFVVLSGSMEPAIAAGDVVVVDAVPARQLAVGDVITFQKAGTDVPVTHRITAVSTVDGQLTFTTKGDANEEADPASVPASRVLGRVVYTIPYIGHVIVFVNTPLGFGALVVIPILLLLGLEIKDMFGGGVRRDDGVASPEDGDEPESTAAAAGVDAQATHVSPFTAAEPVEDAPEGADDADDPAGTDGGGVTLDATAAEDDAAGGIAVTPQDLTLTLGALAVFAAYSGYVAYLLREVWAVTAFAAAVGLLVFAAAIRVAASRVEDAASQSDPAESTAAAADPARSATDGGRDASEDAEVRR